MRIKNQGCPSPDAIYAEALGVKPEILAQQLRLRATDHNIKIAQAGYMPTLSLSGGLGSNYYTTSGFNSDAFGTQLKNNFSQYVGLNLSIPIFNRFQTRNSVRNARIEQQNQQLALDKTKKTLYNEIQQVYYNTLNAQEKEKSSSEAVRSSNDAFQLMQAKYENGKATITEFNEAKNTYLRAESDYVQARYELLYQFALVQFYPFRAAFLDEFYATIRAMLKAVVRDFLFAAVADIVQPVSGVAVVRHFREYHTAPPFFFASYIISRACRAIFASSR